MPVCSDCSVSAHKPPEHVCERISETETKHFDDIRALMTEARCKMTACNEASGDLDGLLSELQQQKETARDLITETLQSYKAALDMRKVSSLGILFTITF